MIVVFFFGAHKIDVIFIVESLKKSRTEHYKNEFVRAFDVDSVFFLCIVQIYSIIFRRKEKLNLKITVKTICRRTIVNRLEMRSNGNMFLTN